MKKGFDSCVKTPILPGLQPGLLRDIAKYYKIVVMTIFISSIYIVRNNLMNRLLIFIQILLLTSQSDLLAATRVRRFVSIPSESELKTITQSAKAWTSMSDECLQDEFISATTGIVSTGVAAIVAMPVVKGIGLKILHAIRSSQNEPIVIHSSKRAAYIWTVKFATAALIAGWGIWQWNRKHKMVKRILSLRNEQAEKEKSST